MKYRIRPRRGGYVIQQSRLGLIWRIALWTGAWPYLFRSRSGADAAIVDLILGIR